MKTFKYLGWILLFGIFLFAINCPSSSPKKAVPIEVQARVNWTVMVYSDADCDLEESLISDLNEIKTGMVDSDQLNVVVLVDRSPETSEDGSYTHDSEMLGSNFDDTRLYQIKSNNVIRIGGGDEFPEISTISDYEVNMSDANTVKKFIDYTKHYFPADHYAIFFGNHGDGPRSVTTTPVITRGLCNDDSAEGDAIYTAELTDVLTADQSVDIIGFDVCLLGSVEVAYQFRPGNNDFSALYMIGSSPTEWGEGWAYDKVFARITNAGGNNGETAQVTTDEGANELIYDPATMTARQFTGIIVEEQYDAAIEYDGTDQVLASYDLS